MDILQITQGFYIDLDEIFIMQIVENNEEVQENKVQENNNIKKSYAVIGITKSGIKIILYQDTESGDTQRCINWINENWLKKKQKKRFF